MDWYQEDGTSRLYALKVQFLGPFLFGQQTLCVKVRLCTSLTVARHTGCIHNQRGVVSQLSLLRHSRPLQSTA